MYAPVYVHVCVCFNVWKGKCFFPLPLPTTQQITFSILPPPPHNSLILKYQKVQFLLTLFSFFFFSSSSTSIFKQFLFPFCFYCSCCLLFCVCEQFRFSFPLPYFSQLILVKCSPWIASGEEKTLIENRENLFEIFFVVLQKKVQQCDFGGM